MLHSLAVAITGFLVGAASFFLASLGMGDLPRGASAGELADDVGQLVAQKEPGAKPSAGETVKSLPAASAGASAGTPLRDLLVPEVPSDTVGIANALDLSSKISLGDPLGTGSDKITYSVKGDPDLAISIVNQKQGKTLDQEFSVLAKEASQLRILSSSGIPTVDIAGYGTFDGHAAIITRRYATGMKAPDFKDDGYKFLNDDSVRDLETIRDTLKAKGIVVRDLQFLVTSDGHVVVADPLRIFGTDTDPHIPGFKTLTRVYETPRNVNFMLDMARRSIDEAAADDAP